MENPQLGQRRWKILMTYGFWVKIGQFVCALLAIVLCVTFDQTAIVHRIKSPLYYSITLKFPFIYEPNVTVHSPPGLPIRAFKFKETLLPSVIAFVVVTAMALVVAIIFTVLKVVHYGSQEMLIFIKTNFYIVLGLAFLQLASGCFWMNARRQILGLSHSKYLWCLGFHFFSSCQATGLKYLSEWSTPYHLRLEIPGLQTMTMLNSKQFMAKGRGMAVQRIREMSIRKDVKSATTSNKSDTTR